MSTPYFYCRRIFFPHKLFFFFLGQLEALKAGKRTYVQLSLNLEKEQIELSHSGNQNIDDIPALIPSNSVRNGKSGPRRLAFID